MFCLYQYGGLKGYIRAETSINKLTGDIKTKAQDDFSSTGNTTAVKYRGIFAWVWQDRLWIWSDKRLRSFKTNKDSVYSFYKACTDEHVADMEEEGEFEIKRTITTDIKKWLRLVKPGDYVIVRVSVADKGIITENLREAIAHDWWPFMPTDVKTQCTKQY